MNKSTWIILGLAGVAGAYFFMNNKEAEPTTIDAAIKYYGFDRNTAIQYLIKKGLPVK